MKRTRMEIHSAAGTGRADAAVGILNGILCGTGCSLAVEGGVEARWQWTDEPVLSTRGCPDDRLVRAVHDRLGRRRGARVETKTSFPPARGLKTSSGAAAALVRAASAADGRIVSDAVVATDAVAACRAAGVTVTGAWDDQWAATTGGMALCDVRDGTRLATWWPAWDVAVWVPAHAVAKADVPPPSALDRAVAQEWARRLAHGGPDEAPQVLTESGRHIARRYAAAGLPVDTRAAQAALDRGALGAGVSGTGPANVALFGRRVALPPVDGGRWTWTRTLEGP